ncbi:hypothetical protein AB0L75_18800 [Streptomyces sp. NPDC052101]|uniref:glycoside hydrolase family 16 protein n=1 Tax=Streptomyces sp. NPDC052101 TaxID=3155763 RepID=UPI003436C079
MTMVRPGTRPAARSIRRRVGFAAVAMLLVLLPAGPTRAASVIGGGCLTTPQSGFAVRDLAGHAPGVPGSRGTATICGAGPPSRGLVVTDPGPSSPGPGKSLAFDEEFDGPIAFGSRWNGSTTSAYRYGNHNPGDTKLDWLTPSAITVNGGIGTFTATPSSHTLENGLRAWNTGMLTTEGTTQGFRTRTGDYAEVRVQLPSAIGAWPSLWTWFNGDSEVDGLEYHPDNPNLLEIVNHVHPAYIYDTDASNINPGAWITVGIQFGATDDDWYLNGKPIYSDHTGVGSTWSPYLNLSLSVCDGDFHPAPKGTAPITFNVDYVRVWRSSSDDD